MIITTLQKDLVYLSERFSTTARPRNNNLSQQSQPNGLNRQRQSPYFPQLKNLALLVNQRVPDTFTQITPNRYRKQDFKFLKRDSYNTPRQIPRRNHRNIKAFGRQINLQSKESPNSLLKTQKRVESQTQTQPFNLHSMSYTPKKLQNTKEKSKDFTPMRKITNIKFTHLFEENRTGTAQEEDANDFANYVQHVRKPTDENLLSPQFF